MAGGGAANPIGPTSLEEEIRTEVDYQGRSREDIGRTASAAKEKGSEETNPAGTLILNCWLSEW